jgi:hypothetical protein
MCIGKGELVKMRKIISAFLAIGMITLAASAASAASVESVTGGRSSNTGVIASPSTTSTMPCFRPGDTINFTVSSVTSGNELTVISAKYNETLSDSTVQYINQYTLSSSSQPVTYTIRDQADGVYEVKINDSVNTVATFYYKIGKPVVTIEDANDLDSEAIVSGTPYIIRQFGSTYSIGFVGRITLSGSVNNFQDVDAQPGFTVTDGSHTKTYLLDSDKVDDLDAYLTSKASGLELGGNWSIIYGMTMYDIPAANVGDITASAAINN